MAGKNRPLAPFVLAVLLSVIAPGCQLDWYLTADPATGSTCVRYVSAAADPDVADGLTWETALGDPQAGINAAAGDAGALRGCEVWVAEGTYFIYKDNRMNTLALAARVAVYGGFAGDETLRCQRDWRSRETVLDGRRSPGGDGRVFHVVTGADDAILDGFTITWGRADGDDDTQQRGAGMINDARSPTVRNCTFVHNEAERAGGAVANIGGAPTLTNCRFVDNAASSGGAMHNRDAVVSLQSCIFQGNHAEKHGGALASSASATVRIVHTVFANNRAGQSGGAIFSVDDAFITVTNSILWDNHAGDNTDSIASSALLIVSYSVVEKGHAGEGNLDRDPKFIDPDGGDFRLKESSVCIDAADGAHASAEDLDGNPRVDDPDRENTGVGDPGFADIGAYEYQPTADEGEDDE